ncbi:hypothetical protein KI387_023501, partial [Taxus chinensis]
DMILEDVTPPPSLLEIMDKVPPSTLYFMDLFLGGHLDEVSSHPPPPVTTTEFNDATLRSSNDSLKKDHLCLLDSPHWDTFLLDISSLFVESHILDLDDTIEDIFLLYDSSDGVASSSLDVMRLLINPPTLSTSIHASTFPSSTVKPGFPE